jgi:hypothetical protein
LNKAFFSLVILSGCTGAPQLWHADAIDTGVSSFDATRMLYKNNLEEAFCDLELICIGDEWEGFLNLSSCQFSSSKEQPGKVLISIRIEDDTEADFLPILKGNMRVKLSPSQTTKIMEALQKGKKADIIGDSFCQTIWPDRFPKLFSQMEKQNHFFKKFL